jgi:hypothetical protein
MSDRHDDGHEFVLYGRALGPDWWSQTGSNRRPPACKAGALPAELWPLIVGVRLRAQACAGNRLSQLV